MYTKILQGLILLCAFCTVVAADTLDQSRALITETNTVLKKTQQNIDQADTDNMQLTEQLKITRSEIENYQVYNRQLGAILASQKNEMAVLKGNISSVESTGLGIMPFMQRMIDGLKRFIESDYPFLPDERRMRIKQLDDNMKRADLSIAAKYRQILEAYQIEMGYGNTMEAYEGELDQKRVVFLKIGRIGFYCLSLDNQHCSAWNQQTRQWQILEDIDHKLSISKAIKIARKQRAPDLFFAAVPPARGRK